jgi:hypothetical protein
VLADALTFSDERAELLLAWRGGWQREAFQQDMQAASSQDVGVAEQARSAPGLAPPGWCRLDLRYAR